MSELSSASVTFYCNRAGPLGMIPAKDCFRIVLVGDSMCYGQGVLVSETVAEQLASLLNARFGGTLFECVTMGIPGACVLNEVGRVRSLVPLLRPSLVMVLLSENDGLVLRPQPDRIDGLAAGWVRHLPLVQTALQELSTALRGMAVPGGVAYFSRSGAIGSFDVARWLGRATAEAGLPFCDISAELGAYSGDALRVSAIDCHLNNIAHSVAARVLSQFFTDNGLLRMAAGFPDSGWLEGVRALPDRLAVTGVPTLVGVLRALQILGTKWDARSNTRRSQDEVSYERLRSGLQGRLGRELLRGVLLSRLEEMTADGITGWEWHLSKVESHLHTFGALALSLAHLHRAGSLGQDLSDLGGTLKLADREPWRSMDDRTVAACAQAALAGSRDESRVSLARLEKIHALFVPALLQTDSPAIRSTLGCVDRLCLLSRLLLGHLDGALDFLQRVAPEIAASSMNGLHRYLVGAADWFVCELRTMRQRLPREIAELAESDYPERLSVESPWMELELEILVPPQEPPPPYAWVLEVSARGRVPPYESTGMHCELLFMDGRARVYRLQIPFFSRGDITLRLMGSGVKKAWTERTQARFLATHVLLPHREPIDIHWTFRRTALEQDYATFLYPDVRTLEL